MNSKVHLNRITSTLTALLSYLAPSINLRAEADSDAAPQIKDRLPFWADPGCS